MTEDTKQPQAMPTPTPAHKEAVHPDALMNDFRGKPAVKIALFTVAIHIVFIGLFSVGYLRDTFMQPDVNSLNDEEKMNSAVRESTAALGDIADKYGVDIKQLSQRFAQDGDDADEAPATPPAILPVKPGGPDTPGGEPSEYEKNLTQTEPPPLAPEITDDLDADDEDDIPFPPAN